MRFCKKEHIPVDIPYRNLSARDRGKIISGNGGFYGIKGFFVWLENKTYKMHIRVLLSKYRGYTTCPQCSGTRFQPETLLYRLKGQTIADICAMRITESHRFFEQLAHNGSPDKAALLLVQEIRGRLGYLQAVGLGYLTLDRQSRTLSGGEVERASLTTALGASLVNTLYILDEPSIGLHARDNHRLISARFAVGPGPESFLYGARPFWHSWDLLYSISKVLVFGFIIPLISVHMGFGTRGGAEGVGRATTSAVVFMIITVLVLDATFPPLFLN